MSPVQALLRDPDPAHQPGPHRGGQDVPLLLRQDQRQPRQGEQGHHLTIASIILTTYLSQVDYGPKNETTYCEKLKTNLYRQKPRPSVHYHPQVKHHERAYVILRII